MELINILKKRGLVEAETSDKISALIEEKKPIAVYCGFDPTAESLHMGNLVAIMVLAWFRKLGHVPVAIVGGATGLIGDPSGKSQERNLLTEDVLKRNVQGIRTILQNVLGRVSGEKDPVFLNNNDWIAPLSVVDFLRDIGKHFRVGTMLARESVKTRLATEEGLSYTEFSYQLLQSYDFYYLFENHNVLLQIGGSDQWGNITAGIDFVRRITGKEVFGLTFPLLLKSDGQKFGKSEKGAVWLSPEKLSPYEFYQYFVRVTDQDVIRFLKVLTFLSLEEIDEMEQKMKQDGYVPNTAQKLLAEEVTRFVHGEEGLQVAIKATSLAMPGHQALLSRETVEAMRGQVPFGLLLRQDVDGVRLIDVIEKAGFLPSKAEGRRLIKNGGLSVNNRKICDEFDTVKGSDIIEDKYVVFSLGKKNRAVIEIS